MKPTRYLVKKWSGQNRTGRTASAGPADHMQKSHSQVVYFLVSFQSCSIYRPLQSTVAHTCISAKFTLPYTAFHYLICGISIYGSNAVTAATQYIYIISLHACITVVDLSFSKHLIKLLLVGCSHTLLMPT